MIIIRDPVFIMVIDNRYRVGEKITNGGYGQVFKIFDEENNNKQYVFKKFCYSNIYF